MNYLFLFSYLSPLTPIPNLALNLAFRMEMREGCAHPFRPVHHAVQGFAPSASLRSPNPFPPKIGEGSHPSFKHLNYTIHGGERGIRTLDPVISGILA